MISSIGPQQEPGDFSKVDLSGLRFPSDQISIAFLRRKHPALFDVGFGEGHYAQPQFFFLSSQFGHAEDLLANMLHCERRIAIAAYADAKGMSALDGDIGEFKEELAELYIRYEIASGRHSAEQLIRDIERQGQDLALIKSP